MSSQPEIVLYGPVEAPYTEKVRRALVLKGLDFELRVPSGPEDYKRWSPDTGLLPVLRLGEELIADSTDILFRLDARFPEPPLLAPDSIVASQQRRLEDWADESFLFYFMKWLRMNQAPPAGTSQVGAAYAARDGSGGDERPARFPALRRSLAWLRAGGTWERPETALLRGIDDRLGDLVKFLGARPFFYASRISMADLAVYGMLYTMRRDAIPGSALLLSARPSLVEFMRRVESETGGPGDAVQAAPVPPEPSA